MRVAVAAGHFEREGSVVAQIPEVIDRQHGEHAAQAIPAAVAHEFNPAGGEESGLVLTEDLLHHRLCTLVRCETSPSDGSGCALPFRGKAVAACGMACKEFRPPRHVAVPVELDAEVEGRVDLLRGQ
jgi:hypothetical protein